MKKTTTLFMTLLLATAITSCNKDGVYNPKEKIDKIYVDAGDGKKLSEDWTWDNKQLKTIDYYSDGTIDYTETFTYTDNRLSQVDNQEYDETAKYTYDKRHLKQADFYKNNVLYMSCLFEYDDNKLSDIQVTATDTNKGLNTKGVANPLKYVLPKQTVQAIENVLNENPTRGSIDFEIDFAWDGNNVSEMGMELDGEYSVLYVFEYDDKLNPFRNFLNSDLEETLYGHGIYKSKNNVTAYTLIEAVMGYSFTESYYISYTYDGRFPATRTLDNTTEYFEYE